MFHGLIQYNFTNYTNPKFVCKDYSKGYDASKMPCIFLLCFDSFLLKEKELRVYLSSYFEKRKSP